MDPSSEESLETKFLTKCLPEFCIRVQAIYTKMWRDLHGDIYSRNGGKQI